MKYRRSVRLGDYTTRVSGAGRNRYDGAGYAPGHESAMSHGVSHKTPPKFRTQLNASSLAQFVDPLPMPEIIQPSGHRPSPDDPAVQASLLSSRDAAVRKQGAPRLETNSPLGICVQLRRGRLLKRAAVRECWWSGSMSCRRNIFCLSTTAFTVRRRTSPKCARWCTCMAPRPAGERRVSGELVCAGQVRDLPLSQSAGRHHAVVPRPCVGN